MNAFTPVIRDSEAFGLAGTPHEALAFHVRGSGAVSGPAVTDFADHTERPMSAKWLAPSVRSTLPRDVCMQSRDAWMQHHIAGALRAESWIAAEFVGISVQNGIVRLCGEVDSMHAKATLLRIATATPGTGAIVDNLWISCE